MKLLARKARIFWYDERAVSMGEYAMLLGFITLGTVAIVTTLADSIKAFFQSTGEELGNMK